VEDPVPDPVRIDALPRHPARDAHVVPLPMTAHDRRRVRRRVVAADGLVLELALPTGTVLPVGQVLHLADDRAYVVAAADEDVVVVRPRDRAEAARIGHLVGNLHRDLDVEDDGTLVALHDAPLEQRLRAAGYEVAVVRRPFRGRAPGEHAH
jgi:urease accessory protein